MNEQNIFVIASKAEKTNLLIAKGKRKSSEKAAVLYAGEGKVSIKVAVFFLYYLTNYIYIYNI